MDNKEWFAGVLKKYNFRPQAINDVLAHSDVVIINSDDTQGGGSVQYTNISDYWTIVLNGCQEEAALHEALHVHWFLRQNNTIVAGIIDQYFIQAGLLSNPRFRRARQACWNGVYGGLTGKGIYWVDYALRYDDREMYAGMGSLVMGDTQQLPHGLREILEISFSPRETVYIPIVFR